MRDFRLLPSRMDAPQQPIRSHSSRTISLYLILLLISVAGIWKFSRSEGQPGGPIPMWNWVYLAGDVRQRGFYNVQDGASIGEILIKASKKESSDLKAIPCWLMQPAVSPSYWDFHAGHSNEPDRIDISRLPEQYYYLLGAPVDINRAEVKELMLIEGIGGVLARRIYSVRAEKGPFHKPEDLLTVKGIGSKTLSKMLKQIILGEPQACCGSIVCK